MINVTHMAKAWSQPGFSETPAPPYCLRGAAENYGNFGVGEADEEPEPYNARGLGVGTMEAVEKIVEVGK